MKFMFRFAWLVWLFVPFQAVAFGASFKHVIIVIQENRTPDNIFGSNPHFEPGVDIASTARTSKGQVIALTPGAFPGCYDIDHSHAAFVLALKQGFDLEATKATPCAAPPNAQFRYADNSTGIVNPYFDIARSYGFANRMFQTNQGPSYPAHQFLFGGTSAPIANTALFVGENPNVVTVDTGCEAPVGETVAIIDPNGSETTHKPIYPCLEHPAISDLLDAAQPPITWRYYAPAPGNIWTAPNAINHICQPKLVGVTVQCTGEIWKKHVISNSPSAVLVDIANCNLPGVSWVIPQGDSSDHAGYNISYGPQWVASIINAVGTKTCPNEAYWNNTVIFVTWDDWGGWYDHVPPFQLTKGLNWGAGYTYGFRVPLLVVSGYTPAGLVYNGILDFGSILLFTEKSFGLSYIGPHGSLYTKYADFQAAASGRGTLDAFFPLTTPRPFYPIYSNLNALFFLHKPKSDLPPDDD